MTNLLRIVLWISLWITLFFIVLLSATNRRNSDLPIRKQSEKFRLLSASFSSSYIYYYYLTYIYILNRLSSSSLKAFNRKNRNFSDFPVLGLFPDQEIDKPNWSGSWWSVFSGSKNIELKDFSRPSAPPRPANPAINPLIESFQDQNLPISGVYSWLQKPCRNAARLSLLPSPPPPNPRNMRAERFLGRGAVSELPSREGSEDPRTPAPSRRAVGGETYFFIQPERIFA